MNSFATDLNIGLLPPKLLVYAYALANGTNDSERLAAALNLQNAPDNPADAWERYMTREKYAPLAALCGEYGLDGFMEFAVSLALAAMLDTGLCSVVTALGGEITAAFAVRIFSASADEAVAWRAKWFGAENTVSLLFADCEKLTLHSSVLRFLLGAEDIKALPSRMERLAARVNAVFTWDDLILPDTQKSLLRHICDRVRHDKTVYRDWGFERSFPYGRGVRALFSGAPGTGKTMAAQVVANDLNMALYRVDLSSLVSKYIGETEKNLGEVFAKASKSGGILFFDEADSIFGKRGEQKDSNDKYANMQTNFLLQQVEDYDGIVLLATNLISNLDAAFTRRIQIRVDFSAPDEAARAAIWRNLLRSPAPLSDDIDIEFLAKSFELTGSEIKNIVLSAAFLGAAENGSVITMQRLLRGLSMEYAKTDKIPAVKDLGEYAEELTQ